MRFLPPLYSRSAGSGRAPVHNVFGKGALPGVPDAGRHEGDIVENGQLVDFHVS